MSTTTITPVLKIALDSTPTVEPDPGDYTDLSDRIVDDEAWRITSVRNSVMDAFQPGRLEVTLDNSDRMLDPSNPSGLVYAAGGEGLPQSWVTFDLIVDGVTERRFTGFLASPAWEGAGTRRYAGSPQRNTVTLVAEDRLAWSGDLPSDVWHVMLKGLSPDVWLPMDPAFPVLVNDSEVPNRAGDGAAVVVESDSNLTRVSNGLYRFAPNLKFSENHKLKIPASVGMPDGDEANLTLCGWWRLDTAHTSGQTSTIVALTSPGGSTKRFDLIVNDAGAAVATWYDSGGSSLDSVTITNPAGRWDNFSNVFWVVRWFSGNNCEVWVGGYSDSTSIATSTVYESDIYLGPSDRDPIIDEVCVWRRSLLDAEVDGLLLAGGSYLAPWDGDNFLGDGGRNSRAEHWFLAAGIEPDADDVLQWHLPLDDASQGFFGLGAVSNVPSNLAEALRQMVGPNGAVWVTRYGYFRVRTVEALSNSTDYAADYITATATLTDASSLSAGDVRHGGVRLKGVDADQVINRAEVQFFHILDDTVTPRLFTAMTIAPEGSTVLNGRTSKQQFGLRTRTYTLDWFGWERAASLADELVDRYEFPLPVIESVVVDVAQFPPSDAAANAVAAAEWLQTLELENAVDVTYTPDGGSAVTVEGLNVQRMVLTGTSQMVRCELMLAQS